MKTITNTIFQSYAEDIDRPYAAGDFLQKGRVLQGTPTNYAFGEATIQNGNLKRHETRKRGSCNSNNLTLTNSSSSVDEMKCKGNNSYKMNKSGRNLRSIDAILISKEYCYKNRKKLLLKWTRWRPRPRKFKIEEGRRSCKESWYRICRIMHIGRWTMRN